MVSNLLEFNFSSNQVWHFRWILSTAWLVWTCLCCDQWDMLQLGIDRQLYFFACVFCGWGFLEMFLYVSVWWPQLLVWLGFFWLVLATNISGMRLCGILQDYCGTLRIWTADSPPGIYTFVVASSSEASFQIQYKDQRQQLFQGCFVQTLFVCKMDVRGTRC